MMLELTALERSLEHTLDALSRIGAERDAAVSQGAAAAARERNARSRVADLERKVEAQKQQALEAESATAQAAAGADEVAAGLRERVAELHRYVETIRVSWQLTLQELKETKEENAKLQARLKQAERKRGAPPAQQH
ncbi:MAG: hypothetical protein AB2A00_14085 [Myxococcota bacterium]